MGELKDSNCGMETFSKMHRSSSDVCCAATVGPNVEASRNWYGVAGGLEVWCGEKKRPWQGNCPNM